MQEEPEPKRLKQEMSVNEKCETTSLAERHNHPRDKQIRFEVEPHKYYIREDPESDKESCFISVTTSIHKFFPQFQPREIAAAMVKRYDFPRAERYLQYQTLHASLADKPQDELIQAIVDMWNEQGKEASQKGSEMHAAIEDYYNGRATWTLDSPPNHELELFASYEKLQQQNMEPYRTEWMVWDSDYKIAGSIDMIFRHKINGTLHLVDWKRSKEIKYSAFGNKTGFGPCQHLPDCNFSQYSLQLNIYKHLLEKNYGVSITDMHLVILHPKQSHPLVIPVEPMTDCAVAVLKTCNKSHS